MKIQVIMEDGEPRVIELSPGPCTVQEHNHEMDVISGSGVSFYFLKNGTHVGCWNTPPVFPVSDDPPI